MQIGIEGSGKRGAEAVVAATRVSIEIATGEQRGASTILNGSSRLL